MQIDKNKKINVLIAEDDFIVCETIREMLENSGYTVAGIATNGRKAVEMTRALKPDVVLMDIKMPEIDGLEATRRIFAECPAPVVMMTAYDTPEYVKQAGEAGAGAYLVKIPATRDIERAVSIAIARFSDSVYEQQKHRIEKAESLARMAGAVAHHFNNILMGVTGNLELAMEKLVPDTDIGRHLSEALKGTWRAADMSGMMLTYLGQSQGKVLPFDLAQVCRRHFDQLPVELPEEVRIKTELPSPGPAVDADVSQVRKSSPRWSPMPLKPCNQMSAAMCLQQ